MPHTIHKGRLLRNRKRVIVQRLSERVLCLYLQRIPVPARRIGQEVAAIVVCIIHCGFMGSRPQRLKSDSALSCRGRVHAEFLHPAFNLLH